MTKRKTNPIDIQEIESLQGEYSIEFIQDGVFLLDDWLFLYPKNQKWGHRYEQAYGYYQRGKLKVFVEKATEEYKFSGIYKGQITDRKANIKR